jgi:hypothetical protein
MITKTAMAMAYHYRLAHHPWITYLDGVDDDEDSCCDGSGDG